MRSPNKTKHSQSRFTDRKLGTVYLKYLSARLLLLHTVVCQRFWVAHRSNDPGGDSGSGPERVVVTPHGILRSLKAADFFR